MGTSHATQGKKVRDREGEREGYIQEERLRKQFGAIVNQEESREDEVERRIGLTSRHVGPLRKEVWIVRSQESNKTTKLRAHKSITLSYKTE